jgi:hypothetical protein
VFDIVPREGLFQRLRDINMSKTLLAAIMRLYEAVLGRLRLTHDHSDFIQSTIGVKQGCPLSPTLFGIYIDELASFLHNHIQDGDGCLLHQVLISLLRSLALIERQCFQGQFQDISSKLYLMEAIIRPTVLYGSEIWGPSLIQTDWARLERVQTLLLRRIIRCKCTVPQSIIQAEFGVQPFRLEVIFRLISFLHRVRSFRNSDSRREQVPLPCTLLLRGPRLRSLHRLHMRMVFRGVLTSPVDDHLPRAPSPLQVLLRCANPSLVD